MDASNSTMIVMTEDESILMRTVEAIVTKESNSSTTEEVNTYFVVTNNEITPEKTISSPSVAKSSTDAEFNKQWSQICRLCATVSDHYIPIFRDEGVEYKLGDKINKYLPVHITKKDSLPLELCYHCAATILAWHELLEGCLNAQQKLFQMQTNYNKKRSVESSGDPLEVKERDLAINNLNRSSKIQTPFKMYIDMLNVNWKIFGKSSDPSITRETVLANCDPVWTAIESNANTSVGEATQNQTTREDKEEDVPKLKEDKEVPRGSNVFEDNEDRRNPKSVRLVNSESFENQDSYRCQDCGRAFKLKDSFLRHMRIHRDERPFTCHVCGKQFRDSGGLSRHLKDVHAKVKNFACDICGNSFASKATREDHRRTHTGERPYVCDSCGKTFKSKASLYIHSKLHTDEFPHPCTYCSKKFRRRHEMLAHVTTHTGEKNYVCDVCAKRFRVKSELVRHKLVHSKDKPFICNLCGLAFRQKRYLNSHIKSRHIDVTKSNQESRENTQ